MMVEQLVQSKLVLLGEMGSGKTSLVQRFVRGQYFENQESTIGASFFTKTIPEKHVKFEIWDTAGQERYHSLAPMYYRGAAAAIVVFDITHPASFERAKKWVWELRQNVHLLICAPRSQTGRMGTDNKPAKAGPAHRVATFLALSFWIFGLLFMSLWWIVDLFLLPKWPLLAVLMLTFKLVLLAVPLSIKPPAFVQRFLRFSMVAAGDYFPVTIVWEGKEEDYEKGPFVIGYEPHSVLPQGICVFCPYSADVVPAGLKDTRILVSSAGFWAPIMRHMWWWLGCRPVSRQCFQALLRKGRSVAVCPGGVKECIYMQRGQEVAYLSKRHGFVRLALQAGAPLVPVFCFGQTDLYSYCRLFFDWPKNLIPSARWASFVRRIGYVPMLVWGWCGSFMPKQVPMYIVVGKPIVVPRIAEPTQEQVEEYLGQFIASMERMFREHRKAAGHGSATLTIY